MNVAALKRLITLMLRQAWASIRKIFVSEGSKFRKNFLLVAKANIVAQALPILAAPVISRLYSPSDFGTFTIFSSIFGLLAPIAIWRIDWSVPNARTRQQAAALLIWGMVVLLVVCVFITFIVLKSGNLINLWVGFKSLSPYLFWLPIVLLGSGLQQLLQSWHIRENDLSPVSEAKINQTTVSTATQVTLGLVNSGPHGLIIGSIFSSWIGNKALYNRAHCLLSFLRQATFRRLIATGKRFISETTNSTGASLIDTACLSCIPLLQAHFFTPQEVGSFSLMLRLAITPISLVTSALSQSFWAEGARQIKQDPNSLKNLYLRTTKKLLIISGLFALCCLSAPLFVGVVFGHQWEEAGWLPLVLIPQLIGQISVSPLTHLVVHKKQHWHFWWNLARFIVILSLSIILGKGGVSFFLFTLTISMILGLMYVVLFYLNFLAYKIRNCQTVN